MPLTDTIALRPRTDADREFLSRLYASTREHELKQLPWTEEQRTAFLRSQFEAQSAHYDSYYSDASFLVVERAGVPVGRFYVRRDADDIRIVDIALLPEARRRGIGSQLLTGLLDEAAKSGKSVTIHVESFNPAITLYGRLGFQRIGMNGVYYLMEWTPRSVR